jgi:hypothetical protein
MLDGWEDGSANWSKTARRADFSSQYVYREKLRSCTLPIEDRLSYAQYGTVFA